MSVKIYKLVRRFSTVLLRRKRSGSACLAGAIITWCFCFNLSVFSLVSQPALAADKTAPMTDSGDYISDDRASGALSPGEVGPMAIPQGKRANFESENKSQDVQQVADWVVDSGDNVGLPFAIVDKTDAKVFVFHADGRLRGATPALLGLAKGDYSIPGIGDRKLSTIRPEERTTPAGRFVASLGRNFNGKDVLWVDYVNAVSLHRVVTNNPGERRLQRLATPTPLDNRISFGCINVPVKFFDDVVIPAFAGTRGIVYVLPETRSKSEIFAKYYDVDRGPGAVPSESLHN